MRGRLRVWSLTVVLIIAPAAVAAVDLNGKWFIESPGSPSGTIVPVTQTGSALSIPWIVPFTGMIGATDANGFTGYSVSWTDGTNQAGFGGRVMPSGNLFDGQGGFWFPPDFPGVFGVIATRCTCDDDNGVDGDGCTTTCQVEPCWTCVGDPSVCTPTSDGGACDDGSPCTTGETCTSGVCGAGRSLLRHEWPMDPASLRA
jgi:cysteine-rich repeat protein